MAIWRNDGDRWELATPAAFSLEKTLHDLVEGAPHVLPLAGDPRIVVLGREVLCGSGSADLLAVESTGRLVILEVKLASNSEARRAVVAQVLAYAAALRGLTPDELDSVLAGRLPQGVENVADAVAGRRIRRGPSIAPTLVRRSVSRWRRADFVSFWCSTVPRPTWCAWLVTLNRSPTWGSAGRSCHCHPVRHRQVRRFWSLSGSSQRSSSNRHSEPRRTVQAPSQFDRGSTGFNASIDSSPVQHRAMLHELAGWAQGLVDKKLVTLHSTRGITGRTTLIPTTWLRRRSGDGGQ